MFTLLTAMHAHAEIVVVKNPNVEIENVFVVGPAKLEASINPGEGKDVVFSIENRTGKTQVFSISFEDIVSGDDGEVVNLLGDKKSETSLKDYLFVPKSSIELAHGERATIPVTISIPEGERAGGKFGAVVVSASPSEIGLPVESRTVTGAVVLGRVATLLFVTVEGDVFENGKLSSFGVRPEKIVFDGNVLGRIVFSNSGNVSLNPYGIITVRNQFGNNVAEIIVDPWFVLPNTIRTRDIEFPKLPTGRYVVDIQLNRGYENVIDKSSVSFVVVTPFSIAILFVVLFAIGFGARRSLKKQYGA